MTAPKKPTTSSKLDMVANALNVLSDRVDDLTRHVLHPVPQVVKHEHMPEPRPRAYRIMVVNDYGSMVGQYYVTGPDVSATVDIPATSKEQTVTLPRRWWQRCERTKVVTDYTPSLRFRVDVRPES